MAYIKKPKKAYKPKRDAAAEKSRALIKQRLRVLEMKVSTLDTTMDRLYHELVVLPDDEGHPSSTEEDGERFASGKPKARLDE